MKTSCQSSALQLFLTRALMPLHKPKCVGMYHQQLGYCVTQVNTAVLLTESSSEGLLPDHLAIPVGRPCTV